MVVHISTAISPVLRADNEYDKPHRWEEILWHARDTARTRASQWPVLEEVVASVSGPFIVAGDFNNPPRGLLYGRLAEQWTDAFAQAGWGSGFTFPAHFPLMRIDYLWLSPSLRAVDCYTLGTRASDHLPVVADILLD